MSEIFVASVISAIPYIASAIAMVASAAGVGYAIYSWCKKPIGDIADRVDKVETKVDKIADETKEHGKDIAGIKGTLGEMSKALDRLDKKLPLFLAAISGKQPIHRDGD